MSCEFGVRQQGDCGNDTNGQNDRPMRLDEHCAYSEAQKRCDQFGERLAKEFNCCQRAYQRVGHEKAVRNGKDSRYVEQFKA